MFVDDTEARHAIEVGVDFFTYLVLYFEFDPFIMTVSGLNRESPVNVYLKLSISSFPPTAS